jgi:hypothetical protein
MRLGGASSRFDTPPIIRFSTKPTVNERRLMINAFSFREDPRISPLAWCLRYKSGESTALLVHGSWVECKERSFVEGAWSGNYLENHFIDAQTLTGSGGELTERGLVLATSTNTIFPIFMLAEKDILFASNSLPFLLAASGNDVDTEYPFYDADMLQDVQGLRKDFIALPTQNGMLVKVHYHCNLFIGHDGSVQKLNKSAPPPFRDFSEYYRYLTEQVEGVIANAQDAARKTVRYAPLATISTGYDSPACAVLGKKAGCKRAITFTTAATHNGTPPESDSGKEIGRFLGMDVKEYEPMEYLNRNDYPEIEFMCMGVGGAEMTFASVEPELPKSILLTGILGDLVWNRTEEDVGSQIVKHDSSGVSFAEFRLRIGFLCLPIPFIGCLQHPSIHEISNAEEMQPWSIPNSSYDRPIPRRIAEEAGIPRSSFGQRKKVTAQPYLSIGWRDPPLENAMTRKSLKDFEDFVQGIHVKDGATTRIAFATMRALYYLNYRFVSSVKFRSVCDYLRIPLPREPLISFRYKKPKSSNNYAFHWSVRKVKSRYPSFDRE